MKVLLINGSPREKQCTYTALSEITESLNKHDIDTDLAWIGKSPIIGCQACDVCKKLKNNHCVFDDVVNGIIDKAIAADGLIVGTPVYYAGANGALLCLLDRMFCAAGAALAFKPAAGIASARRAGTTPAIDQINKYFLISKMPLIPSNYWPMIHGTTAEEATQDKEGLQIMRVLGQNMAWMLKMMEISKKEGLPTPEIEPKIATNFIH